MLLKNLMLSNYNNFINQYIFLEVRKILIFKFYILH